MKDIEFYDNTFTFDDSEGRGDLSGSIVRDPHSNGLDIEWDTCPDNWEELQDQIIEAYQSATREVLPGYTLHMESGRLSHPCGMVTSQCRYDEDEGKWYVEWGESLGRIEEDAIGWNLNWSNEINWNLVDHVMLCLNAHRPDDGASLIYLAYTVLQWEMFKTSARDMPTLQTVSPLLRAAFNTLDMALWDAGFKDYGQLLELYA